VALELKKEDSIRLAGLGIFSRRNLTARFHRSDHRINCADRVGDQDSRAAVPGIPVEALVRTRGHLALASAQFSLKW
jgi:hypothetical protein